MRRRSGKWPLLLVAVLTGGALLAGCAGEGTPSVDRAERGTLPVPVAPDGGDRAPTRDRLSTFALDVDTASYGHTVRTLGAGRWPDAAGVRPEEFVNSFRQDYTPPEDDGFSVTTDGARLPAEARGGSTWSLLRVGLATRPEDPGERPPAALTFVVDTSSSMGEPGRLDLVKRSLHALVGRLGPDDSVAIVAFSGNATTVLPMTRVAGHHDTVAAAVSGLETDSNTNLGAGVRKGYDVAVAGRRAGATNRVVLLSDGLANTGDTDPDSILERIGRARDSYGITLSGVGVGSTYGDALMERLADRGDGFTTYLADDADAERVFVARLPAQVGLRARDAKAQVAFDRDTVASYRLLGYEDRAVPDDDFRDDAVDGGEVGPGHTVTALYAVRLRPGAEGRVATATVRWLDPRTRAPHERSGTVSADALAGPLWSGTAPRLRVDAVAAFLAEALRRDPVPGAPGLAALAEEAGTLARTVDDPDVHRLAEAVADARDAAS